MLNDSERIFKDVNIKSINFINNKNDVKIEFIDSLSTGGYCGHLICSDIRVFNMTVSEDDDLRFPQVICDVYAIDKNEKMNIRFLGGNYEMEIICVAIDIKTLSI